MFLTEKDCVVCGKSFETIEQHNEHYEKCANQNIKTEFTTEEIFDAIHNEKHY